MGSNVHAVEIPLKAKESTMDALFAVHKLNDDGQKRAAQIAAAFDDLLTELNSICLPGPAPGRTFSLCRTKLEEACFFAKKSLAEKPENQES